MLFGLDYSWVPPPKDWILALLNLLRELCEPLRAGEYRELAVRTTRAPLAFLPLPGAGE